MNPKMWGVWGGEAPGGWCLLDTSPAVYAVYDRDFAAKEYRTLLKERPDLPYEILPFDHRRGERALGSDGREVRSFRQGRTTTIGHRAIVTDAHPSSGLKAGDEVTFEVNFAPDGRVTYSPIRKVDPRPGLGQLAYETFTAERWGAPSFEAATRQGICHRWPDLPEPVKQAWEAAARKLAKAGAEMAQPGRCYACGIKEPHR